jgi:radical SAM-linked protein
MSFPSALPLGVEGPDEVMDLELAEDRTGPDLRACLEGCAPPGLTIRQIDFLPEGTRKPQILCTEYALPVPAHRQAALAQRIADLTATSSYLIQRREGRVPIDLRSQLERLELVDGMLHMRLKVSREGSLRARDVLAALGLGDIDEEGAHLTRTRVELKT